MRSSKLFLFLVINMFLISESFGNVHKSDSVFQSQINKYNVVVKSVSSLKQFRPNNSAMIGDRIVVVVSNLDSLVKDSIQKWGTNIPIYLSIGGTIHNDIPLEDFDLNTNSLIYNLDSTLVSLKKYATRQTKFFEKSIVLPVSINISGKYLIKSNSKSFKIFYTSPRLLLKGVLLIIIIGLILFLLKRFSNIMRVGTEKSPFSLAQVQLAFWTIIIAICVLYIFIVTYNIPDLTGSILALLGISAVTTAGSKYVNNSMKQNTTDVTSPDSKGFFHDILSDKESTNIQRFQMVVWTLIMGIILVYKVLVNQQLYDFDDTYLILTGISSGTYVFLKFSEK